ncbi:S41 family peptidase [Lysinibacillus sp. KU-BSD001]|uniref:S41 family peptidase n=1 Tax=Lysinibacillus sp. KU-BSD001 TaxID=3141328 RepID=UPI0036E73CF3
MRKVQLFLALLFLFLLPVTTSAAPLSEIKAYVEDYYVGEINGNVQEAKTVEQVIDMLDPYSTYYTAEQFKAFMNAVNMTSVGIGIVIDQHEKGILITDVIENGSAFAEGIVSGDIITHINGKSAAGMTTSNASALILGKEDTTVTLTFLQVSGQSVTKTIVRKPFSLPNATTKLLYGKIGYISLASFSTDAATLVKNGIRDLTKKGATSFIFDLQNNGGGYVEAAEEVIGLFPHAKVAYTYEDTSGKYTIYAKRQSVQFPANTRVLINGYSASASEMTAAALVDQQAAILYGEKSYGKGTMQTFYELSDGSYLKLTMARFAGPTTTTINEIGVQPHIATTGDAIYQAHADAIAAQYANYKELPSLLQVPTTKTFTINFKGVVDTVPEGAIELVKLGGEAVATSVEKQGAKLVVKPTQPLATGEQYMLLIHPTIKGQGNNTLKKGSYLYITVK